MRAAGGRRGVQSVAGRSECCVQRDAAEGCVGMWMREECRAYAMASEWRESESEKELKCGNLAAAEEAAAAF